MKARKLEDIDETDGANEISFYDKSTNSFRLAVLNGAGKEHKLICRHLRQEGGRIFCGKDYKGGHIDPKREMVTDYLSMQFWCTGGRHEKCIWYTDQQKF